MRYQKNKKITLLKIIALALVPALLLGTIPTPAEQTALAYTQADLDALQEKIDALRAKEDELSAKSATIAAETAGFERERNRLNNDIAILENDIAILEAEIQKLQGEIETTAKRIADNSEMIGYIVAEYYYSEKISTVERLASSQNLAEFIDEEARLSALSENLTNVVKENKDLKTELEKQQSAVKVKQDNQKSQKQSLEARKAELQRAISLNQREQAEFAAEKAETIRQRKLASEEHSRILWELTKDSIGGSFSKDKGGFPDQGRCPGQQDDYIDRWGMYACECVSYAAWKVQQYYGLMVKEVGRGSGYNGGQWPDRFSGIVPQGRTPRARAVASWSSTYAGDQYGHVAWVDYIDSSGNVWVSEYNVKRGDYSERNASASSGLMNIKYATFIYFDEY